MHPATSRRSMDHLPSQHRLAAGLVVFLLLLGLLTTIPVAEAPGWGHRFMVYGRILDDQGDPAQNLSVTVAVETDSTPYPQMTVRTDCHGLFYSQKAQPHPGDHRVYNNRLHLHHFPDVTEYADDAEYIVSTPYANYRNAPLDGEAGPLSPQQLDDHAIHSAPADRQKQSDIANIHLDTRLDPDPDCQDAVDWRDTHVVVGKVQEIDGDLRIDHRTLEGFGEPVLVDVTLETEDGSRTEKVMTDEAAMYIAIFENVTVQNGARVSAIWDGHARETTADTEFHVTAMDLIIGDEHEDNRLAMWVFLGLLVVAVMAGVGIVWDARKDRKAPRSEGPDSTDGPTANTSDSPSDPESGTRHPRQ